MENCLDIIRKFPLNFFHIYKEVNTCVERQLRLAFLLNVWWDRLPSCCSRKSFFRDRVGLFSYRFRWSSFDMFGL